MGEKSERGEYSQTVCYSCTELLLSAVNNNMKCDVNVRSRSGPDQVQIRSVLVLVSQVKTVTRRQTSGENRVKGQDTLEGTVVKTNPGGGEGYTRDEPGFPD